jgi:hypothetical protein
MAKKKSDDEKYQPNRKPELRIQGVSNKTKEEIQNIADNEGIGLSEFMRPHLRKIIDSYPEHKRKPKPDF